jgi:hypothetical protein
MSSNRKPTELSAGLVAVKGAAAPANDIQSRETLPMPHPVVARGGEQESLTFKVAGAFRREFKTYAAAHGLKLTELLSRSFQSYRKQQGD